MIKKIFLNGGKGLLFVVVLVVLLFYIFVIYEILKLGKLFFFIIFRIKGEEVKMFLVLVVKLYVW